MFNNRYKNKKVFITGHTGFKGSWLVFWLQKLGATVFGYSLKPPTEPNHFDLLELELDWIEADIRDLNKLKKAISDFKPDIVFHLAAQPLVRESYKNPVETFEVNAMGTVNIFEACRGVTSVKAIINVTSDKCYENREWAWGYRETEPMGGYDPYSASKGASELITNSYRQSFFNLNDFEVTHNALITSCRAGNVIGGGDWAEDRLIPDIVKATSEKRAVEIRNPQAIRPWQFVLEPLSGYLLIGEKLLSGEKKFADAWNFGPNYLETLTVKEVSVEMQKFWKDIKVDMSNSVQPHEANYLKLDCSKANSLLNWKPVWSQKKSIEKTVLWYKDFYQNSRIETERQFNEYIENAKELGLEWVK